MNDNVEYASGFLIYLSESVGRALPGIFAGLAVIAGFLIATAVM